MSIGHMTSPGGPLGAPALGLTRCSVEIPGVGRCEVKGEHPKDGAGRPIHRRGYMTWNGAPYIGVDDHALNG